MNKPREIFIAQTEGENGKFVVLNLEEHPDALFASMCKGVRYIEYSAYQALLEIIKKQQEALEFYGEKRLYVNLGIERELYDDSGDKARATLQETKEELEKMGVVE